MPTYGSKEAIFSLAQVLGTARARRWRSASRRIPVYERGALFAGARVQTLPLRRENGFLPDLAELDDDVALVWVNYPHNPTGAVAPLEFYDELAEAAERHDFVDRRRTRRTRSSGSTSRRRPRCRRPTARASSSSRR